MYVLQVGFSFPAGVLVKESKSTSVSYDYDTKYNLTLKLRVGGGEKLCILLVGLFIQRK